MATNLGVTTHDAEEWRPVEGWPGCEVSNLGGVRTQTRRVEDGRTVHGRPLRPWRNGRLGHLRWDTHAANMADAVRRRAEAVA